MSGAMLLIDEALHGCPADDRGRYPAAPNLQPCLSALACGEPKRALALLDSVRQPDARRVLTAWSLQLDRNRYPGGVGTETDMSELLADSPVTPGSGDPEVRLLEHLVDGGPPGLSTMRTVIALASARGGDGVPDMVGFARHKLAALREFGTAAGHSHTGLWTLLAEADLMRRASLPDAEALMSAARLRIAEINAPELSALSHLVEGDWYAAPGSSPEFLGYFLQTDNPLRADADVTRARDCYRRARNALGPTAAPRLRAALSLREAMLDTVSGDPASALSHLASGMREYQRCGDQMGYHLAGIHAMIADIERGHLARYAADLGNGWFRPTQGPVARLLDWATSVGSTSWAVGLGILLERCAAGWFQDGKLSRARLGFLAAAALQALDPNRPSLAYEIVHCDTGLNLTTNAVVRMERFAATVGEQDVSDAPAQFAVHLQIALTMLDRLRAWSRGPAAPYAAERIERVGEQLRHLVDRQQVAANRADITGDEARQLMAVARLALARAAVYAPMTRAEHARRIGALSESDRWFDLALDAARGPDVESYLAPLVLASARRNDAVRAEIEAMSAKGTLPDSLTVRLASQIYDAELAVAALDRLDGAGDVDTTWGDQLLRAEVWLLRGDTSGARSLLEAAVTRFEDELAEVLRDADRLAVRNGIDAALLYATLARTQRSLPDGAAESLATCERLRALSYPDLGANIEPALRLRWEHGTAQYAAVAERLVVDLATAAPGETTDVWKALDDNDSRLADIERELETAHPGIMVNAAVPGASFDVAQLQSRLAEGTVLFEYLAVADNIVAWAVTREDVRSVEHTVDPRELASTVRSFHLGCSDGHAATTGLARLLLEPFADLLRTHPRVLVVPFGDLSLVPFQALSFDGKPLGLTHVVSYLPRAAAYRPDEAIPVSDVLVVGDPDFDPTVRPGLSALPGARIEAAAVARRLGSGAPLTGAAATLAEVSRRAEGCKLLHLCTHGQLDELSPYATALVLAGSDQLTVADLAGMRLGHTLTVLAGCDTGRGSATLGGDLIGLTRALMRAGVRQAVVSMWPVDDDVAPIVMDHFYAGLAAGQPPAQALAGAQRTVSALDAEALGEAYRALGGEPNGRHRRRGEALPPEFVDDDEIPVPLGGDAERFWAPFVLVG